jgi:hypothetical protein
MSIIVGKTIMQGYGKGKRKILSRVNVHQRKDIDVLRSEK